MALTDDAITQIKLMIVDGRLARGERLPPEKDLSERLGLSRNSLREAVKALELVGVLDVRQGDGTYVTSLDAELLLAPMVFMVDLSDEAGSSELHAVRRILETETAGLAARASTPALVETLSRILDEAEQVVVSDDLDPAVFLDIDIRFHHEIAVAAGNRILGALVDTLSSRTFRERMWRAIHDEGALERTHLEHRAILGAIADGQQDHARTRMANHLLGVEGYVQDLPSTPDIALTHVAGA
jgi:DNA-binding FadR family transcriptional regulator